MKLLLLQNMIHVPSHGGANKANRSMLEGLAGLGHECSVVAPAFGSHGPQTLGTLHEELENRGFALQASPEALSFQAGGVAVTAVLDRETLPQVCRRRIQEVQPDWVLVTSEDPGQQLLRVALDEAPDRVVYIVHTPLYLPFGPEGYVRSEPATELIRRAAGIITVSDWVRNYIRRESGCRATVLRFPVYGKGPFPRRPSSQPGAVTLVNPCAYKGLPIFVDLARRFPEIEFLGVETWGTTAEDRQVLKGVSNIRLRPSADAIDEIFAETRILLMPSLFLEAFGLLAVEARLRGIPVLASDSGGLPEANLGLDYVLPVQTIETYQQRFDDREFPMAEIAPQSLEPWVEALEELWGDGDRYESLAAQSHGAAHAFLATVGPEPFERYFSQLQRREVPVAVPAKASPKAPAQLDKVSKAQRTLLALQALKARKRANPAAGPKRIPVQERSGSPVRFPLSFAQERLWFLDQLDPGRADYNLGNLTRIRGPLNLGALREAVASILNRHEVLRARFVLDGEAPVQEISSSVPVPLAVVDGSGLTDAEFSPLAQEEARLVCRQPFNLGIPPLLRLVLFRHSAEEHRLLVVFHHIVSDGWSAGIFLKELVTFYQNRGSRRAVPLATLEVQYADYGAWQRQELAREEIRGPLLDYWREQLQGFQELEVPFPRPRGRMTTEGARLSVSLPADLRARAEALAQRSGGTLFMVLLAAFKVVLQRYSGQRDVVVGTPVAARTRSELEPLIGFFVNSLALRTEVAGELSFAALVARVRETVVEAQRHQDLPFEQLVQEVTPDRSSGRNPIFRHFFTFQGEPEKPLSVGGLALEPLPLDPGTSVLDLSLQLSDFQHSAGGWLVFGTKALDQQTARRFWRHFVGLLGSALELQDESLHSLSMIGGSERHQILIAWNDTARARSAGASLLGGTASADGHGSAGGHGSDGLLFGFEAQVDRDPEAVALRDSLGETTYGELEARSNRVAHWLRRHGAGPESVVGILLERSPDLVVAVYGVLKAGAAYLPLDPSVPPRRLEMYLEDARPSRILTEERFVSVLEPSGESGDSADGRPPMDLLPRILAEAPAGAEARPLRRELEDPLAYVLFTSGSTGRPKGAMISHRAIVNRIRWMQEELPLSPDDRVLQKTPFSFDVSVWELLWPLAAGASLVLPAPQEHRDPRALADVIHRHGVTVTHFVPSMLRAFVHGAEAGDGSSVRAVIAGGEELTHDLHGEARRVFPEASILHSYGPTETAIGVTSWRCEEAPQEGPIPIGRPVANTVVYVLDDGGRPMPVGLPGELHIGGLCVGRGYVGKPALTAARFIPDPFSSEPGARLYRSGDQGRRRWDGALEYGGRGDSQVKVRGVRIELVEVERALLRLPLVREAVVLLHGEGPDLKLMAYLVPAAPQTSPLEVRKALLQELPESMVPGLWMFLEELPKLTSGKVDRKALPSPTLPATSPGRAPQTFLEEMLQGIWEGVLGLEGIGVEEDLFSLGAHSLLVTQVRSRVERALDLEVPLRILFESPTIEEQGRDIEALRDLASGAPPLTLVAQERDGALPLSFAQQRLWFFDRLEPGTAVFNIPAAIHLGGELDAAALTASLNVALSRHEVLRSRFLEVEGDAVQVVDPHRNRTFPVLDLSGLGAEARSREQERLEQREASRPFDLTRDPMLRAALVRLELRKHLALLTLHHIAADGWSLKVLIEEVSTAYTSLVRGLEPALAKLPIQYADYALWQRRWLQGEVLEGQFAFWRKALAGAPETLQLPTDRPRRSVQRYRGDRVGLRLPRDLAEGVRRLAQEQRSTVFMVLASALNVLLLRYANQSDLALGTLIANRHRQEVEPLIGFFVNTLILRTRLETDWILGQVLTQVREASLQMYAHQDLPFEKLVEELNPERHLSLTPLFQVLFIFQNTPSATLQLPGLELERREVERKTVNYDLLLAVGEEEGEIRGHLDFDTDLFDAVTLHRWVRHLRRVVQGLLDSPDLGWRRLSLLSPAEGQQLLREWNDTDPTLADPPGLMAAFHQQGKRRPEAVAAEMEGETLTYGGLVALSEVAAWRLGQAGVRPREVVAILADRGLEFLVGCLGLFRCSGAYLPLDPQHPDLRIAQVLEQSGVRRVLVADAFLEKWEAVCRELPAPPPERIRLETIAAAGGEEASAGLLPSLEDRGSSSDPAYVLFTSGSTGTPKGVQIHQQGLTNHLWMMVDLLGLDESTVLVQNASQCFDISVWQFFAALVVGGRVLIVPDRHAKDPRELVQQVEKRGATVLELVPSLLDAMLEELEDEAETRATGLQSLRWLIPTGEALNGDLCERWQRLFPDVPMLNAYGPAECSDDVSALTIRHGQALEKRGVSIGRPLRACRLYLLDPAGMLCPIGALGEIHVGGIVVGQGYRLDPRRTAAAFLPDPWSREAGARIYSTGDLGRLRNDGAIEFVGRKDFQVKIRGFRIEIGEVEACLRQHPGVAQAVVAARAAAGGPGMDRLVAYVIPTEGDPQGLAADAPKGGQSLQPFLLERLPDYFVPTDFVLLESFPLNANGKVDLRALPDPEAAAAADLEPPQTQLEKVVADIWASVLPIPAREEKGPPVIGRNSSFFDLGGHSLLATRVLSRLRSIVGVDLALRDLFEARTLRELALRVEQHSGLGVATNLAPIEPAGDGPLPLSFSQERLWFLEQLAPGGTSYNLPSTVRLEGTVSVELFHRILNRIVGRHQSLRTIFEEEGGHPRQRVLERVVLPLQVVDLQGLDAAEHRRVGLLLAERHARHVFNLQAGPLLRATLIRWAPAEHLLLLNMHHIVSDGWSMAVFMNEIQALYRAHVAGEPPLLPELAVQYPDFAAWQRRHLSGEALEEQLVYWQERLAGAPPVLDLPGREAPPPTVDLDRGRTVWFRWPRELSEDLRDLSGRQSTTLFMTLLTGFGVLLYRYGAGRDLPIGVPVAGRDRPELESLIGFFVNTLVLRLDLGGRPRASEVLARVRQTALEAFSHQDVPFEHLVARLNPERDTGRSPLFQVMFALQNAPLGEMHLPDLRLEPVNVDSGTTRFELFLEMSESGDRLAGSLHYAVDLFESTFIERLLGHLQILLQGLAADAERALEAIPLLSPAEEKQLFGDLRGPDQPLPFPVAFEGLFSRSVDIYRDSTAVACEGRTMTYGELDEASNRLAQRLRGVGVEREVLVAVLAERSERFLVVLLGILKVGGVYLPLDPRHPPSRLAQVLRQAQPRVILHEESFAPLLGEALDAAGENPARLSFEESLAPKKETGEEASQGPPPDLLAQDPEGGRLAYVIFTSGSTGVPKGAMLIQRGMVNHLLAKVADLELTAADSVAQTASQSFDISVWQFLAPLVVGARVEVYGDEVAHDPGRLLARSQGDGITILETVPSLMRLMLEELERDPENRPPLTGLRWLIPTGEALPPELCNRWYRLYPSVTLLNAYGPTECSDDITHFPVFPRAGEAALKQARADGSERSVAIGTAVLNMRLYILDRALRFAPPGVPGELCAGGEGVGRGYWRSPSITAQVFVPDPFSGGAGSRLYRCGDLVRRRNDGNLVFLGRLDHQVKIRGLRLELGDIEASLEEHPDVRAAVVLARREASGTLALAAFVVGGEDASLQPQDLRAFLKGSLPDYAIPTSWTVLEQFPLSSSGKVDRQALSRLEGENLARGTEYVAPRDEVEEVIAEIFCSVVGLEKVGIHDHFFDLGGHSLLATQAISRLREAFGVELPLRALFDAPTIAELGGVVEAQLIEQIDALSEEEVDSLLAEEEEEEASEEELSLPRQEA